MSRLSIVCLSFARNNYLSSHVEVLNEFFDISELIVDEAPYIRRIYRRRGFLLLPFEFFYFVCYLLKNKPKYVYTVGPKLGFIFAICSKFLKNTKHIHWFTGQVWSDKKNPKKSASFWVDRFIYFNSDFLFSDGLTQKEVLNTTFGNKRLIYSPVNGSINGVDEKCFIEKQSKNNERLNLCFIGRKAQEKGIPIIFQLAEYFSNEKLDVDFMLAGPIDETYESTYFSIKDKALKKINNINFIDNYVDPSDIFKDQDILLLPSSREGFGSIVIEAQAAGLPVICSNIYGLKDAFINNVTGIACNNEDVKSYIDAIYTLSSLEKYTQFSVSAKKYALKFKRDSFKLDLYNCYQISGVINNGF